MKELNNMELKQVNGGGAWDKIKGGLSDMKDGFKEGLNGW